MNQVRKLIPILLVLIIASIGLYAWNQKRSQVTSAPVREYSLPARIENIQIRPSDKGNLPLLEFEIAGTLDHVSTAANLYIEVMKEFTYSGALIKIGPQIGKKVIDLNTEASGTTPGRYRLRIIAQVPGGGLAGLAVEAVSDEFEIK